MGAGLRRVVVCFVGVAVLVAAACAGDDDSSSGGGGGSGGGSAEGTYTFGINAELSGPIDGSAMVRGVNAYVEHVNANGGIDGHTIEVVELDNAGDQSRAAANTTQLVTADEVTAIFGHLLSANCTASTADRRALRDADGVPLGRRGEPLRLQPGARQLVGRAGVRGGRGGGRGNGRTAARVRLQRHAHEHRRCRSRSPTRWTRWAGR